MKARRVFIGRCTGWIRRSDGIEFGFIHCPDLTGDVYVPSKALRREPRLQRGDMVRTEVGPDRAGRRRATRVELIERGAL
jgi:cold shock CspA family protein